MIAVYDGTGEFNNAHIQLISLVGLTDIADGTVNLNNNPVKVVYFSVGISGFGGGPLLYRVYSTTEQPSGSAVNIFKPVLFQGGHPTIHSISLSENLIAYLSSGSLTLSVCDLALDKMILAQHLSDEEPSNTQVSINKYGQVAAFWVNSQGSVSSHTVTAGRGGPSGVLLDAVKKYSSIKRQKGKNL